MTSAKPDGPPVLLTGATGYVGGELLGALVRAGRRVRCMVRRPEALWNPPSGVEVVRGDVLDPASLTAALCGTGTAFYLVHSMVSGGAFEDQDRRGARNFGEAAREAGVKRIIYLGGLGDPSRDLSAHLRSRQEVGEILRLSGVPVIEFRASIVIGCGSFSFEMIRSLVERLPVMITPRWVATPAQPIAISDLLEYLTAALDLDAREHSIYEIGGADVTSYGGIMREYARRRGLRRFMIPVPVLTPRLSSLWLGLVTPYYARVGRKLVDGLQNPTVVRDDAARRRFALRPLGLGEAIARALEREDAAFRAGEWKNRIEPHGTHPPWGGVRVGSRIVESRRVRVGARAADVYSAVQRVGGDNGWYYADWLWRLRAALDRLAGGVGLRKGRPDPERLEPGDTVDFWRVEESTTGRRLRLLAEMKVPGRAWLEFEVEPDGDAGSELRQTAMFDPIGLFGICYWYLLYPVHDRIFAGMLRGIAEAAARERASRS